MYQIICNMYIIHDTYYLHICILYTNQLFNFIHGYPERRHPYRLRTPPSSEALRHSGGDSRRCTSATVTLYFDVELSNDSRPGTEQKTSLGAAAPPVINMSIPPSAFRRPAR
jgi:hypothetical protein